MACVYIPVQNSEEEVRVALDQLPRDATDILDILKAEQAPLDLWLIIAREYFKQGKNEQFRQILEEGSSPEIDEYYADVRYERIAILNALGAYYSYLGKIETKQREKEEHFIQATQYYNKASRIDMHEPSTWVGKGEHYSTVLRGCKSLSQLYLFGPLVIADNEIHRYSGANEGKWKAYETQTYHMDSHSNISQGTELDIAFTSAWVNRSSLGAQSEVHDISSLMELC